MMFRNSARIILISSAVAAAGVFFLSHADRRKTVESLLRKAQIAIETENIDKLAPMISMFYRDDLGMSCASLNKSFEYIFFQFNAIAVDYRVTGITVGKDTVTADILVWGRGTWMGAMQDIAGSENDWVPVSLLFKSEFFRTKVVGSRWPRGQAGQPKFY
jgi:hypothetical protein